MMQKDIELIESADLTELEESAGLTGARYRVRLIEGDKLGSTGYYPAETLLRDGPKVFKKGTPMYLDHISAEDTARGSYGSVAKLAGELAEDAYYDGDGLYAEIEVFEHQRHIIKSLQNKIGISIRARGRTVTENLNGQLVPVFKELLLARSADFVVKAGAGGKIVSILESAPADFENYSESEEGREMQEVLDAIESLKSDFSSRLTALEEATKPAIIENVESVESADADAKILEVAEALGNSKLDGEGRSRVLDLHRANGKPLADLIAAEETYVAKRTVEAAEEEGTVEESVEEAVTPTIALPSAWKKDKK